MTRPAALDTHVANLAGPPTDPDPPELGLARRWQSLTLGDLPTAARPAVATGDGARVERALTSEEAIAEAARQLPLELARELEHAHDPRAVAITVRRLGLVDAETPTLEVLAREYRVTRERIRQLELPAWKTSSARCVTDGWLATCVRAWADLHRGRGMFSSDVRELAGDERHRRALALVADHTLAPVRWSRGERVWATSTREAGLIQELLERGELLIGADGWDEAIARLEQANPALGAQLRLETLLPDLTASSVWDVGPDLWSRLIPDYPSLTRRVARKVATFLAARACPIAVGDLADRIGAGAYPFEVFERPPVTADWVRGCVTAEPELLTLLEDGDVWLASDVDPREPTGRTRDLWEIVIAHGEPIAMQELVDAAAARGISRNQVGQLIHSGRAACLFMLRRGVVGLVGRDEHVDPDAFSAASRAGSTPVRPGHGVGTDEHARLAADIIVRRSVHEQGLSLPWPLNIATIDAAHTSLFVGEAPCDLELRPNGDLRMSQFAPGSPIRATLLPHKAGRRLELALAPPAPLTMVAAVGEGQPYPTRVAAPGAAPLWVEHLLDTHRSAVLPDLDSLTSLLPDELSAQRRRYAVHALLALGMTRRDGRGWHLVRRLPLPTALQDPLDAIRVDPKAYTAFEASWRAATVWMARAAWLSPDIDWSEIHEVGAHAPRPAEQPDIDATTRLTAATLQIAEGIELTLDRAGDELAADATAAAAGLVRRCLVALGCTAYGSIAQSDVAGGRRLVSGVAEDDRRYAFLIVPRDDVGGSNALDQLEALAPGDAVRRVVTDGRVVARRAPGGTASFELRDPTDAARLEQFIRAPIVPAA